MSQSPHHIIRLCKEHLRRLFANERIWQKTQDGILSLDEKPGRPRDFVDHAGRRCVASHELRFYDPSLPEGHLGRELSRGHWYKTEDGTIGGSGLPDPKDLLVANVQYRSEAPDKEYAYYRLHPSGGSCELCAGGDPIPDEERSWEWKEQHRPDLLT